MIKRYTNRHFTILSLSQVQIDWVKVLRPTLHKTGHFGDVIPSQSLGAVLKKLNLRQQKQTTQEENSLRFTKNKLKPKTTLILRTAHMCLHIVVYNCRTQHNTTTHRTVLIIFPLILQTIIIAQMMSTGRQGNSGIARVNEGPHSFICHPHVHPHGVSHACLYSQPQSITALWPVPISTHPLMVGDWLGLGDWLRTDVVCPSEDVTHPNTNRFPERRFPDNLYKQFGILWNVHVAR